MTHKHKRNNGEISQYYTKNHHLAIITRELFQKVQKRRKKDTNVRKRREYLYPSILICAHCRKNYTAIRERYSIFWKCNSAMLNNGMQICNAERISQLMIDLMLTNDVDARFPDSVEFITKLESTQNLDFMECDRSIMKKQITIVEMEIDDTVKVYEELQTETLSAKADRFRKRLKVV
ncbi:MAG: recombinase family protein [Ruminococcus sp.]|nr:recombinase family protein [Ruminococcus sp.]